MKKILIQFDTDSHPSSFDRVVAVDSGIDEIFSYGNISPENVESLVHGAMFTRGPDDLKNTAIFVGGSRVEEGEKLLEKIQSIFFGPIQVSVMMDSNGSNTTAAAAVLAARKHLDLSQTRAVVLGGTGPVGRRAAEILALERAEVTLVSRSQEKAQRTCEALASRIDSARLAPFGASSPDELQAACQGAELVIAAGAAGVQFLSAEQRKSLDSLKVAIDVNAVPPQGLEGIEVTDKAAEKEGALCYGAIGVGGRKMKIHKAALKKLFEFNTHVFDTEAIYRIGEELG